jgi:hypothetical protein
MNILLTALVLSTSLTAVSTQTNQFYITDEGKGSVPQAPFSSELIEKARHAKDSRPAEDDSEGHWGTVTEGFQLSLRFEKDSFTNGEPVVACVILRNVSDKPLTYPYEYSPDNREINFVLLRDGTRVYGIYDVRPGATFQERLKALRTGHGWTRLSPPGTQRNFYVNLSDIFNLTTNGQYIACATRAILKYNSIVVGEVSSGNAGFRVTGPSAAPAPHQKGVSQ